MPIAALFELIVGIIVWVGAIAAALNAVFRSTDHRVPRVLVLLFIAASWPGWYFIIGPWIAKDTEARQLANAMRGDEAAAVEFASRCASDSAVVVGTVYRGLGYVDIVVVEDRDNFGYALRSMVGMYVRSEDQSCVGKACQFQIHQNPSDPSLNSRSEVFLNIGKAQISGNGRIRKYELVLSRNQKTLGSTSIYRFSRFAPPNTGDSFCPDIRDQLKSLLEKSLPEQYTNTG